MCSSQDGAAPAQGVVGVSWAPSRRMTKVRALAAAQTARTWSEWGGAESALRARGEDDGEGNGGAVREDGVCWLVEDSAAGGVTAPTLRSGPVRGEDERHAGSLGA